MAQQVRAEAELVEGDPVSEYVAFFEQLAEQPDPPALLSTHPNPEERARAARRALDNLD
ncbi:MAG: hypothetical protein ACLFVJ_18450 [Persicimonas sp.]